MKKWEKPMLTVLVRSKPAEAILTDCKSGPAEGLSGPGSEDGGCSYACYIACDGLSTS
jgi:hypothetical protein